MEFIIHLTKTKSNNRPNVTTRSRPIVSNNSLLIISLG